MIKHQIFVNKHLPVQIQRKINISKRYSICSSYSVAIITFGHISLHLGAFTIYSPLLNSTRSRDSKHSIIPYRTIS